MITEHWRSIDSGHYPHQWEHTFDPNISQSDRQQWFQEAMERAQLSGIELVVNETENGYEIGFKNVHDWTAFVSANFGNLESEGAHVHTETFPGSTEPNPEFIKAADGYLAAMGIEFTRTVDGNVVNYAFNNFMDRATFQWLTETGELDRMADQLSYAEEFQQRFEAVKKEVDAAFELHR